MLKDISTNIRDGLICLASADLLLIFAGAIQAIPMSSWLLWLGVMALTITAVFTSFLMGCIGSVAFWLASRKIIKTLMAKLAEAGKARSAKA